MVVLFFSYLLLLNPSQSECLIFQALVARLTDGTGVNTNNGIISGVLVTVGDLARVVGIFGISNL